MASYRKECFDLREKIRKLEANNLRMREMVDELCEYLQERVKMDDFCDWLLRRKGLGDIADRVTRLRRGRLTKEENDARE